MTPQQVQKLENRVRSGYASAVMHPIFGGFVGLISRERDSSTSICKINKQGVLKYNIYAGLSPHEWEFLFFKAAFHLGMGHVEVIKSNPLAWNAVCNAVVYKFLDEVKICKIPDRFYVPDIPKGGEQELYNQYSRKIPEELKILFTNGEKGDFCNEEAKLRYWSKKRDEKYWKDSFSNSIKIGLTRALAIASGSITDWSENIPTKSNYALAFKWILNSYPLLGSVAAHFKLIESIEICRNLDVQIAAINSHIGEIYVNPVIPVTFEQAKFIIAHELLHASLMHHRRLENRDPYLWNIACDFVINNWLVEMRIGEVPMLGFCEDDSLKNMSAEEVYDEICKNKRKYAKLRTLKGEKPDITFAEGWWDRGLGIKLDELCKHGLSEGLQIHLAGCRGTLPADLVEEIQRITARAIGWDVQLARWFDERFPLPEPRRTYGRPSRRQAATKIPLPSYYYPMQEEAYTYGIVLDTSGSMDRRLLGMALGAIISYSEVRGIKKVRLVYNDAQPYDEGWVEVASLLYNVEIKGRGGTVLQPAFDYLEKQNDFPKDAPILVITDGFCEDGLTIKRDHAYLMPKGNRLPFTSKAPVFYLEE